MVSGPLWKDGKQLSFVAIHFNSRNQKQCDFLKSCSCRVCFSTYFEPPILEVKIASHVLMVLIHFFSGVLFDHRLDLKQFLGCARFPPKTVGMYLTIKFTLQVLIWGWLWKRPLTLNFLMRSRCDEVFRFYTVLPMSDCGSVCHCWAQREWRVCNLWPKWKGPNKPYKRSEPVL